MTVDGCRALCCATFVLFFSAQFALPWSSASPVPVRPYRLALLRRRDDSGRPETELRRAGTAVNGRIDGHRRRRLLSAKFVATDGGTGTATVPLPVVAYLKAVAKRAKPRAAGDTRRRTIKLTKKEERSRAKLRHKKRRRVDSPEVITIHSSGLSPSRAARKSKQTRKNAASAKEDEYYKDPHSDDDYDRSSYSRDPEVSYSEDSYHEDDHADGYGQDSHQYSDTSYNEAPYDEPDYQESYHGSSDGYQDVSPDEYGHDQSSYQESEAGGYQEGYDSGYSQESYPASYHESDSYHETSDNEEQDERLSYHETDPNDYHQDDDYGSHEEGHDGEYPPETYPQDSYPESEYDDTQPYQPAHEEPEYHENSYEPDYRPRFPPTGGHESYHGDDQSSYQGEADAYPAESTHDKDYGCPGAPGKNGSSSASVPSHSPVQQLGRVYLTLFEALNY